MHKDYSTLLKKLTNSYYNNTFDDEIESILRESDLTPLETTKIISSLCGVDVPTSSNYIYDLKKAITYYNTATKLVEKVKSCNNSCSESSSSRKCVSACPFNAIIEDPLTSTLQISDELCTGCGLCVNVCESGNYLEKISVLPLLDLLKNNNKVIAAVAPAIVGQWGENTTLDQIRAAFIKLGFTDMVEVAFAADMLTIKEAVEFNRHVNGPNDLMITSCCCPMWVGMLKKVYGKLVKDVSPSVSPMIAAGRVLKILNPGVKVVFVGPCIAKKAEAKEKDISDAIDFVLTFEEVKNLFDAVDILPEKLDGIPTMDYASKGGRLYARTGGVSIAISEAIQELYPEKHKLLKSIQVDGIKNCKEILNKAENNSIDGNFIEGMGCIGGCVGGPKVLITKEKGKMSVDEFAQQSPIKIATHSRVLDDIFEKLGINSLDDFIDDNKTNIFHREF